MVGVGLSLHSYTMNEFEFAQMEDPHGTPLNGVDLLPQGDESLPDMMQGPPPPVYNIQPPLGISVTTPSTVPQAFQPQQAYPKPPLNSIGSGVKGPDILFRVHMGLQSGVSSEIDWCLTTLLTFTTARNFDVLKARVDIMVSVIRFISQHWDEVIRAKSELDDSSESLRLRQKVLDALLIIRNVCIDQSVAQQLAPLVASFVESGISLPLNTSLYTEMRLLCLEIAEHACFYFPNQSSDSPLFTGLITLLSSNDKSVLISAMRCLTRLLVFDVKESSPLLANPKELAHINNLLLIDDADLIATVLDTFVQFTSRLQRVEQLQSLQPILLVNHLVRLLSFKVDRVPSDYMRLPQRTRKPAPLTPPEIPAAYLTELLTLDEPERATMWIRSSYNTDPEGEVLQVALWTGYQRIFEPHERDGSGKKMLKAIDFIRTCTTNVRGAQAKVVTLPDGQRKFIIKGLVPRESAVSPSQLRAGEGAVGLSDGTPNSTNEPSYDETEKSHRPPPVFGNTAALVLLNICKLQGGKDLLEPLIADMLTAMYLNPAIAENIDKLLSELKSK